VRVLELHISDIVATLRYYVEQVAHSKKVFENCATLTILILPIAAIQVGCIEMKATVISLILLLSVIACRDDRPREISYAEEEEEFPIVIEGGTKVVYQVGKMTPRGLKFYLDTVDTRGRIIQLPDSVRSTF
jgi:hypothetical protein